MVLGNRNSKYFVTNLDTFEGNSGSPVIDAQTGLVEGILYEGKEDFNYSDKYKCSKTAVFSSRQADERVMRITEILNNYKRAAGSIVSSVLITCLRNIEPISPSISL
jgi:V8-like Glu-specific endopeptidase